ncbi:cta4 [Symbiodinium sp. KB8]|nr:cta4 [Symbiodinium sp. KB8]
MPESPGEEKSRYRFESYCSRPPRWTYDAIPFSGAYGATLAVWAAVVANRGEVLADHFLLFLLPVALHVMLFLATQWSVEVRCRVRFYRQPSIDKATHVKVVPLPREGHANDTRVALVPLIQADGQKSINYLKKKFVYNSTAGKFERLHFEITSPLESYLGSTGLTAKEVDERTRKYGENIYDIPLPDFWELFQEHAVAPFFVFQLFCVLLWLMDEYWYYSLLTLLPA